MADNQQVTRYDERFAAMAAQYAGQEHVGGDFLSIKGGVLTFQDEPLPGNQIIVVILDVLKARLFYTEKYDPAREVNLPPKCYALWRDTESEPAPHVSMKQGLHYFEPQNDICRTCPNNEWGSSDTGKGKACGEKRRFALLPAGVVKPKRGSRDMDEELFTDPEHYASADVAYLQIPVTSVKEWAKYVTDLASELRLPPAAVVTRIFIEPDPKTQFKVKFEMIDRLPVEILDVVMPRYETAVREIEFGYQAPDADALAASSPRRGIRR